MTLVPGASDADAASARLAIDNVSVRRGARTVLDRVALNAQPGELICVLGPNGAGKTTLLRAIAGLIRVRDQRHGGVTFGGVDLLAATPGQRARLIAYLPQGHAAHWPILVRDAVAIGRVPHGARPGRLTDGDHEIVNRVLGWVDATHLADRPVTELSGGERARVMLARALAVEAPVLLADEAVAALDPGHRLAVMALLRAVAQRGGIVLAALHDLTLAARFASRVLVLDDGRPRGIGPPGDVLTPALLANVFGIRAAHLWHEGQPVLVPWSTGADSRR